MSNTQSEYSVLPLLLPSGERLPCLIESSTWNPTRVATRWAVRYRRNRVQSSTLAGNLRHLGKAYSWARTIARIDLDDFLCSGHTLDGRQIESLAAYVREPSEGVVKLSDKTRNKKIESEASPSDYLDAGAFDNALSVIENFLKWSLDAANRGGRSLLTFEKLILERSRIELIFDQLRIGAAQSHRIEPLEEHEVEVIRKAIGPSETTDGWRFPRVFAPGTRFRNWLMFETALELGLRRGELLKLKVASLPRGSNTGIRIIRYPDDPEDTRAKEPAVKTAERVLPASRGLLRLMNTYLTSPPPLGRISSRTPYLFVTTTGAPTSLDRSDDTIKDISGYSGVAVSWHRLRHTWAEKMAQLLCEKPNGLDQLQWLGGWTSLESPKRYIQNAIARSAQQSLTRYQESGT